MAELAYTLTLSDSEKLDAAEGDVRSYCGWHIAPSRTETVRVRPANGRALLPSLHVTDVIGITRDGVALTGWDWTEAGVLTCVAGCDPVDVEFTHGYDVPPPEVAAIVSQMAAQLGGGRVVRKQIGPFSEQYEGSGTDRAVLDRYRLPPSL